MHTRLSVNLNKVALLRNQRDVGYPSVEEMARIAIAAGAHGITVHPRPDARHVRRADVYDLGELVRTYGGAVELNVEGFPSPEFVAMAREVQPAQVTLVPDAAGQRTSDHGWRFADSADLLRTVVADLSRSGIRVSLFVERDVAAMPVAKELGADCVELYTAAYAAAFAAGDCERTLAEYVAAAEAARRCGLGVNAGHDLTLENLPLLKRGVPMLAEVSVGHAMTADALKMGFLEAVRAYLAAIS
jgi:pyridoxine 5-phosphate synthase